MISHLLRNQSKVHMQVSEKTIFLNKMEKTPYIYACSINCIKVISSRIIVCKKSIFAREEHHFSTILDIEESKTVVSHLLCKLLKLNPKGSCALSTVLNDVNQPIESSEKYFPRLLKTSSLPKASTLRLQCGKAKTSFQR